MIDLQLIFYSLLQGSASFLLGLFFLFVRWPIVGIILQIYGCIALFGLVPGLNSKLKTELSTCVAFNVFCIDVNAAVFGHLSRCFSIRFQF